jgi:leader peptidase (prepilin peptidase)/N-methyltransferase
MSFNYAEFSAAFPWFFPVAAFALGACVGSFLNVVIYRVPKNESIVTPGSHCGCGQPIAWHDNIPILSWVLLRGKARCCGRSFSPRYPFIEFLTACLFLVCWLHLSPAVAMCGWVFVSALIAATFIDLDHFIIPDAFTYGLAACGLLLSLFVPSLHGQSSGVLGIANLRSALDALIGLIVGSGVILWIALAAEKILKKEAMGFGDVTFVGGIGTFCGWQGALFAIFGGSVVGVIWTMAELLLRKLTGRAQSVSLPTESPEGEAVTVGFGAHVPFGPMMAIAAALYFLVFRDAITAWFADIAPLFSQREP